MEILTHALSGALVARALPDTRTPALSPRSLFAAGAASALFPDIDFVLRLADPLTYLNHHQGITHSLLLWPLWSLLLAHLFARLAGLRGSWRAFLPIAAAGIGLHIAGDLITAYGVQLFAPLSSRRYAGDIQFLVDFGMLFILLAGLAFSLLWPRSRTAAVTALGLALLYVSGSALLRQQALGLAAAFAETVTEPVVDAQVLPQPPTPFHWLLLVSTNETVYSARANLAASGGPSPPHGDAWHWQHLAAFQSPDHLVWRPATRPNGNSAAAAVAWNAPALEPLRRFMRFPVLDVLEANGDETCARFIDLRFTLPGVTPSFRFGACRHHDAPTWRLRRWPGDYYLD